MANHYQEFHCAELNKGTKEDPVTLEELPTISQNGRQTIGYLRCVNRCPLLIVHYSTDSAHQLFVSRNYPKEPETNSLLNQGFTERIKLYHKAVTTLSPEQLALSLKQETPELEAAVTRQKKALFWKYLNGTCTFAEKLILRISLFIDDTDVLQVYDRTQATAELQTANDRNWLIRQSSIRDTDIIKIRAISFKKAFEQGIGHVIIVQIYGYGFMISPNFPTNQSLNLPGEPQDRVVATMGSQIPLPTGAVYPSFIDALDKCCLDFDLNKLGLIGSLELSQTALALEAGAIEAGVQPAYIALDAAAP